MPAGSTADMGGARLVFRRRLGRLAWDARHYVRRKTVDFVDALRAEGQRLASWRASQLSDHPTPDDSWRHFPRERVLILRAEHLVADEVADDQVRFAALLTELGASGPGEP